MLNAAHNPAAILVETESVCLPPTAVPDASNQVSSGQHRSVTARKVKVAEFPAAAKSPGPIS
jgi:hypothetical protein